MKTYQVMMSDLRTERVNANSAADAIQLALMKNPGKTVTACNCPGMSFDIPPHKALTAQDVEALKPKREPVDRGAPMAGLNKPAPWIEDWMKGRKVAP